MRHCCVNAKFQPNESKPWNPWIASVFYRRGLIETWGRGTLKIAGLMQEAELPAPDLKDNAGFVTLTFILPASAAPRIQGSDLEKTSGKTPGKTSGKILDAVRQNPQVTIPELSAQIGVTTRSIERNLRKLQDEKRLLAEGNDVLCVDNVFTGTKDNITHLLPNP
ncbi:MAG: winged helix-turn-helix transcriptional regulator [Sulfuricaulis sp.]|nr:winged helix-turn-helix transcriptional regulator [Sulfuricaulis sp.]